MKKCDQHHKNIYLFFVPIGCDSDNCPFVVKHKVPNEKLHHIYVQDMNDGWWHMGNFYTYIAVEVR